MQKKTMYRIFAVAGILLVVFWAPFLVVSLVSRLSTVDTLKQLPRADAVIVFGAHITEDGEVTPLLKERLEAGIAIVEAYKANTIVVSNTERAARVMAQYLENRGIPARHIETDISAETTPDTCIYEKQQHPEGRELIFVSQGFHLPRLLLQCEKVGVQGTAFPAEMVLSIDRSQYSFLTVLSTRMSRYTREAGLTWLIIFDIY